MVEDNRETFVSFLQNARPIIQLILRILDAQLGLLKDTLASLQRPDQPSGTIVRLLRYPPWSSHDQGTSLITHPDIGPITMLSNVLGGLQILPPDAADEDANWQYIKPESDCVIINLGDAMVEWTGDILRSNKHRAVSAPGKQAEFERLSVGYLMRPELNVSMKWPIFKAGLLS